MIINIVFNWKNVLLRPLTLSNNHILGKQIQGIRSDRVPEELWTKVHNIFQETDRNNSKEKEMQQGKVVVCGGILNS